MAIYGRKEIKINADVAQKKAYDKYYKEMRAKNKQPMTYYHWNKSGRRSGYGGTKGSTKATARLRRSERKSVDLSD